MAPAAPEIEAFPRPYNPPGSSISFGSKILLGQLGLEGALGMSIHQALGSKVNLRDLHGKPVWDFFPALCSLRPEITGIRFDTRYELEPLKIFRLQVNPELGLPTSNACDAESTYAGKRRPDLPVYDRQ